MLKFTVYQDRKGEWRWRAKRGGRIVAESGEGYTRRRDAFRAVRNLVLAVRTGEAWKHFDRYGADGVAIHAGTRAR